MENKKHYLQSYLWWSFGINKRNKLWFFFTLYPTKGKQWHSKHWLYSEHVYNLVSLQFVTVLVLLRIKYFVMGHIMTLISNFLIYLNFSFSTFTDLPLGLKGFLQESKSIHAWVLLEPNTKFHPNLLPYRLFSFFLLLRYGFQIRSTVSWRKVNHWLRPNRWKCWEWRCKGGRGASIAQSILGSGSVRKFQPDYFYIYVGGSDFYETDKATKTTSIWKLKHWTTYFKRGSVEMLFFLLLICDEHFLPD